MRAELRHEPGQQAPEPAPNNCMQNSFSCDSIMTPPQNSSFRGEVCVSDKKDTVNWELETWVLVLGLSLLSCVMWTHPIVFLGPTFFMNCESYKYL